MANRDKEYITFSQRVPAGAICGRGVDDVGILDGKCVFMDRDENVILGHHPFTCRRNPGYELAVEHYPNGYNVLKCPRCLEECAATTATKPTAPGKVRNPRGAKKQNGKG